MSNLNKNLTRYFGPTLPMLFVGVLCLIIGFLLGIYSHLPELKLEFIGTVSGEVIPYARIAEVFFISAGFIVLTLASLSNSVYGTTGRGRNFFTHRLVLGLMMFFLFSILLIVYWNAVFPAMLIDLQTILGG